MHQACDSFHFILKKAWNCAKKTIFWLILRGFWFTTFYALWVTPQSLSKLNTSWRYIIVVRFICVAFVVVKLWSFKCFLGNAASTKRLLLGDSWPFLPQIWLEFAEISTRSSLIKKRQPLNNLSKLSVKAEMRHIQKWWFWSILGPIYPRETENITKNQHFPKNYILTTIK